MNQVTNLFNSPKKEYSEKAYYTKINTCVKICT